MNSKFAVVLSTTACILSISALYLIAKRVYQTDQVTSQQQFTTRIESSPEHAPDLANYIRDRDEEYARRQLELRLLSIEGRQSADRANANFQAHEAQAQQQLQQYNNQLNQH